MIRMIFLYGLLLGILPALSVQEQKWCKIEGQISGFGDGQLLVHRRWPEPLKWFTDTAWIKDGKFHLDVALQQPVMAHILLKGDCNKKRMVVEVLMDESGLRITGNADTPKSVKIEGGKAQEDYLKLKGYFRDMISARDSLVRKITEIPPDKALERMPWFEIEKNILSEWQKKLLEDSTLWTNTAMPYFLYEYFSGRNIQYLEKILNRYPPAYNKDHYWVDLRKQSAAFRAVDEGTVAPEFCLFDVKGEPFRLSDYRGHYVLLDFSASWCSWCKREVPYLRQAYELGKEAGLVIFTVNMDTERKRWEKEVEECCFPWEIIGDLQGFKGKIAEDYNVYSIPQIFLIDPEGHIVARDLRGDAIIESVLLRASDGKNR